MEQIHAFGQFPQPQIEETRPVTVEKDNPQVWQRSQEVNKRLEVKITVHEELSAAQSCQQIIFPPEALRGTGENRFSMHAVAAKITGQAQNAVEIAARTIRFAFTFQPAQGFPRKIFGKNCFFFMSLIAGDRRLKVKTQRTTALVLELGQFTDFLAGDAHSFAPRVRN